MKVNIGLTRCNDNHLFGGREEGWEAQFGEDKIISAALDLIYSSNSYPADTLFCEFGASDGSLSNLSFLLARGWCGVFIEVDKKRFSKLKTLFSGNESQLKLIQARVGVHGDFLLSNILQSNKINPIAVKVLSIDIDGDDALVLETVQWDLDLLVIEYNPSFSFDVLYTNPVGGQIGNSPLAICQIAKKKRLALVALTESNLIFVNESFEHLFEVFDLKDLKPQKNSLRFAMGYDGTIVRTDGLSNDTTSEVMQAGWGGGFMVQPIPKIVRSMSKYRRLRYLFSFYQVVVTRPFNIPAVVSAYLRRFYVK